MSASDRPDHGEYVPATERDRDLVSEARETAFAALAVAENDPLARVLLALSDWVEVETTDHDSFGPRQDARVALIKAYDDWMKWR